jgi:hypothetical protein
MEEVISVINDYSTRCLVRELSVEDLSTLSFEAEETTLAVAHCINDFSFSIVTHMHRS